MSFAVLPDELLLLAAALAVAGAAAGLLAGIFGIGGGGIIVPILYQFLGMMGYDEAVRMHVAIGTSLGAWRSSRRPPAGAPYGVRTSRSPSTRQEPKRSSIDMPSRLTSRVPAGMTPTPTSRSR